MYKVKSSMDLKIVTTVYPFAFRDILAISSEVFYSMFYGPMTKPRDANDPIVDDDIDPEAFRLMLKYALRCDSC